MTLLFPIVFFSVLDYTYFNWRKNSMKVKNSLDEILYEHIVESLINGDYEMGQNLTLDELAHRFEVSRTPVVQAVKLLANDGILQIMGNGRIYVPEYDQEHVRQMCEVRQMVEGHALERFMSGLGLSAETVLAQLNRYSEEGVRLTGSSFSPKEFAMLDRRFHRLLVEASGNRILLETYDRVQGRFLVSNYLLCPLRLRDFSGTARDHVRLVESIRSGDITRAQHCLQQHIEGVLRRL
ncbi:transcriptional regulator, GntR family [Oscillibacter sp. KLE 1728]|jgi:DNA-binding GntR family transcriptional regulator|nr:transcriptional regulator, GntR family [Oscillibacter sp. KLE 1728]ERK65222.1 transcriptional regulator, GntR family [Oscillibacter sp. KLE 1745]MUU11952.1 GntR family transcriptional regulator [Oscillibacter sp.]